MTKSLGLTKWTKAKEQYPESGIYTCMKYVDELSSTFYITWVTWVTFSETFCVRSLILLGAMISISVEEGGLRRSEPKDIVTWGMWPIARCRIKSESEVEFKLLGFRSENKNHTY